MRVGSVSVNLAAVAQAWCLPRHALALRSDSREVGLLGTRTPQDPVEDNGWCLELTEPKDSAMIPDDAGYLSVEQEYVKGRECYVCGYACKMDEPCCETDEQDEYEESFS